MVKENMIKEEDYELGVALLSEEQRSESTTESNGSEANESMDSTEGGLTTNWERYRRPIIILLMILILMLAFLFSRLSSRPSKSRMEHYHTPQEPILPFTCAGASLPTGKDLRPPTSSNYNGTNPLFDVDFIERSRLFPGTGTEVRRVMKKAMRDDSTDFKILILGGSITICHGLAQSDCWPNLFKDFFVDNFDASHRGASKTVVTDMINLSQPATGTSYFGYCLPIEIELRAQGRLGKGPDLVILEFGINDVWPINDVAKKDVERLLRVLRTMESNPAIIMLDAASLRLAKEYRTEDNPEMLHLPAATYYDVPILSVKSALFGPAMTGTEAEVDRFASLSQDDNHHPNPAGHKVLLDVLTSYIEEQACTIQEEAYISASQRSGSNGRVKIDRTLDLVRDDVLPLPNRSLFQLVGNPKGISSLELAKSSCLAVGTADAKIPPVANQGWSSYVQSSDKQYLVADVPGSVITFDIEVGKGGAVLVDFLRSASYDLGEVLIRLDDDQTSIVSGKWDLRWSIGVPTEVFSNVPAGRHRISFQLLAGKVIDQPTAFRLIGMMTT